MQHQFDMLIHRQSAAFFCFSVGALDALYFSAVFSWRFLHLALLAAASGFDFYSTSEGSLDLILGLSTLHLGALFPLPAVFARLRVVVHVIITGSIFSLNTANISNRGIAAK